MTVPTSIAAILVRSWAFWSTSVAGLFVERERRKDLCELLTCLGTALQQTSIVGADSIDKFHSHQWTNT